MRKTTSVSLALSALICLFLLAPSYHAVAQARGERAPARETQRTEPTRTPRPGAEAEAAEPGEPAPQPELTDEELRWLRELREAEAEPEVPEVPEVRPLTAAERFAALERFGMRVFGPVEPERAPEERTDRPEQAADGRTTTRDDDRTDSRTTTEDADRADRAERAPTTTAAARPTRPIRETRVSGVVASEAVPPTYVVGPGDQLAVRVWTDAIEHVEAQPVIDAEGNIYLELLGEVTVAGERLSRVREIIRQRYRTFFDRAEVSVGLSRTRVIEVRVTGDVRWPGTHVLSGAATLFSALHAAGGPGDVGSFRAIRLIRRGEEPLTVDLYDYLLDGQIDADLSLEPNDTIFVPPLSAEFGVTGEVRRPARYEIKDSLSLAEGLRMAAGISATGYARTVELWRVGESGIRELINVNLRTDAEQMTLLNGDLLVIPPVLEEPENIVRLEGEVRRPGAFQVHEGMTVSDLLGLGNGLTTSAHTREAAIWRLGDDLDYDQISFDLAAALAGDPRHDLPLMPRDRVMVFSQEDVEAPMEVGAEGAVRRPGAIEWTRGMRVSDLVKQVGGLVEGAYTLRANLLRLGDDQRRELLPVNLGAALAGDAAANLLLQRGDILSVLSRLEVAEISQVHVTGLVQEGGWYERPQGMRVSDAILAAGGLASGASGEVQYTAGGAIGQVDPVYLLLRRDGEAFEVEPDPLVYDNDLIAVLGTGDLIATPPAVTIRGRVSKPGSYALQATAEDPDTVYDLITRAGGLLPNANPNGIVLYRLRDEIIGGEQSEDLQQVIAHFNRELSAATVEGEEQRAAGTAAQISAGLQAALSEGTATMVIPPRRLSETQWARAVPIDGETLISSEGAQENFPLAPGDVVIVPETPTTVTVMGAVVRPGAVPYQDGLMPLDYIAKSGDLTPDARRNRTVVIRANGEVTPNALRTEIRPGDVILVPSDYIFREVNKPGTLERVLAGITTIIGGYLIFR
ncbi:MAG: SLBB domain-containing protein [Armatimonadota bacterium]